MGRVADDLYLIAYEERSGRCRVSARAVGLGLAAGVLAELVLGGHLRVSEGGLFPGGVSLPAGDRMLREALALIVVPGQERDVAAWLAFLAAEAAEDVRHRLATDGVLREVRMGMLRKRQVFLPRDSNAAAWPGIRLAKHLSQRLELSLSDQVLTALVQVTGLLPSVLWFKPEHGPGYERAAAVRGLLPADLAALVAHAEAGVGQGVLAGRGT